MPFDDHKNFAISNVDTAPSPSTSGTTLVVTTGHGTRFPTVPFNATVWPRNQMPDPENAEIVRVTNITGDVFTIVRAQEGTVARDIGHNDQIANTATDKVFEDIETAISNIISAGGGGVSVTSQELSTIVGPVSTRVTSVEAHVDTVSAAVAAVEVHASAASAAATSIGTLHSVLSDRVTSISAQLVSLEVHASAASAAATSIGTLHNTLSDRVTSISAQLTSLEVHASAASAAATSIGTLHSVLSDRVTSISAQIVSVNALLASVSAVSGATSVKGIQSVINQLSQRISSLTGGAVTSDYVSGQIASAITAVTGGGFLSLQNRDAAAVSAGAPVYVFTSANTFKKADASAVGAELVVGLVADNSVAVSAVGRIQTAGKVVLSTVQWDAVASTTGGLTPGTVYYLHTIAGRITDTVPTGSAVVHPIGQALSPTEMQLMLTPWDDSTSALSTLSAGIVSVDLRVTSINSFLASLSVRTTAGVSIKGLQSVFNAMSNRISAAAGASITSAEFEDAKSVGSATASNLLSHINALSAVIASVSAVSGGSSTKGLQSVINQLSNRISSLTGGGTTTDFVSARVQTVNFLSLQNVDASAVSAGTPVYAFTSANTFKEANASAAGAELVLGLVAATAIAVSAVGLVQTAGKMSLTSTQWGDITGVTTGLTPGDVYYLGTSAGTLTTAAPTSGVVHVVGQALSPNEMQLMLSPWDDATSALSTLQAAITGVVALNSGGVSVFGLQSVINALSDRISAGLGGATTAFVCAQVAAASAQAASALEQAMSAGSATASNLLSNINVLSNKLASVSAASGAGSINGLQSVINQLSQRISSLTGGGVTTDYVSARVASVDARVTSLETVLGSISAHTTAGVSVNGLQSIFNALSNRISAGGGGGGSVTSAELSASVQMASAAATSVDARVASLSAVFASISARTSVAGATSVHGLQSVVNALSAQISSQFTFFWQQVGNRQMQNVDAISAPTGAPVYAFGASAGIGTFKLANASAASPADRVVGLVNWGDIAVSAAGDVQFGGLISLASATWDLRTGQTGGLTPGDPYYVGLSAGTLTTAIPALPAATRLVGTALTPNLMVLRIGGGGGSVTSTEFADAISVGSTTASNLLSHIELLSGKVVSISAQLVSLEVHASTASAAATSVDLRLDSVRSAIVNASAVASIAALSLAYVNDASVSAAIMANVNSVLSAAYGMGQLRALGTGTVAVSATSYTKVSGMSISLAANTWYHVQGRAIFTLSAAQGTTFGFVYPGTNNMATNGYMTMACLLTIMAAGPSGSIFTTSILPIGRITGNNMSTVATANLSAGFGTSATLYTLEIDGLINTNSATGATGVELMVKQSATGSGVFIHPGSYVRAYKVV